MKVKVAPKVNKPKPKKLVQKQGNGGKRQASVAAAYSTTQMGRAPMIKASRDTCNIKHRELISNVRGSIGFLIRNQLELNPGLSSTFPWLSVMAQGWEQYRFKSLRFCYKTRTGSNTKGSLIMAPDYDAADGAPASEQIMSTYAQVIEDATWKDITCQIKTSNSNPLGKHHFVRNGPLQPNLDIKTYDIGTFFLACVDGEIQDEGWGKLWVEYDIDFYIPQLPPQGAVIVSGGLVTSGGFTYTAANPLGPTPVIDPQSSGISVDNQSRITFQRPGSYLVSILVGGTTVTGVSATGLSGAVTASVIGVVTTGTQGTATFLVTSSGADQRVQISSIAATVVGSTVSVSTVPQGSVQA